MGFNDNTKKELTVTRTNSIIVAQRREEVYKKLVLGFGYSQIAKQLGVSTRTIKRDAKYIFDNIVNPKDEINKITLMSQRLSLEAMINYEKAKQDGNTATAEHWWHRVVKSLGLRNNIAKGANNVNVQVNTQVNKEIVDDEILDIYRRAKSRLEKKEEITSNVD